jgi:hypothetical protein
VITHSDIPTITGDLKMATFLEQAKEVLAQSPEKISRLELLARKSADFDTTSEEDSELMDLKKEVKTKVATRDRDQNLRFIKEGGYSVEDVLGAMGVDTNHFIKKMTLSEVLKTFNSSRKEINSAVKKHFDALNPKEPMKFPIATYFQEDVFFDKRMTTAVSKAVKEGGVKGFVANLTDSGKSWLLENHVPTMGKFKDVTIYPNVSLVATKFKMDKIELMKELNITKKEKPKGETVVKKADKQAAHA